MNKTTSIIISIIILIVAFYFGNNNSATPNTSNTEITNNEKTSKIPDTNNSEIKSNIQYVTILAKGGYSPRESVAKANIPTKLIIKTNETYDCSSSLVIRSLNYKKILPNTGETIIDIGTPKQGDTLQGICGMGMYNFLITFK